jgi:hypothetical protein
LILLAAILLIAAVAAVLASRPASTMSGSIGQVDPAQTAAIADAWGIRFASVAVTAAGGFVDVRFQVIDPEKALGTHDPEGLPTLIDASTGMVFDKGGSHAAHQDTMRAGGTYYLLYQNTGGRLKPGSRISIQIGDVRLDNVIVQ